MKFQLTLLLSMLGFLSYGQGYKSFDAEFFNVGDSLRVDVQYVFGECWGLEDETMRGEDASSLLEFLTIQEGISISINAHTDTRGSAESNKELSVGRANSIRNWLIQEGVNPRRLSASGWGEGRPVVPEKEINPLRRTDRKLFDSLHNQNRRLTIIISNIKHKSNCQYPRTVEPKLMQYYRTKDMSMLQSGDRFRLGFVRFDAGKTTINNLEKDRDQYLELAEFIHCNPDLKFNIIAHTDTREKYQDKRSIQLTPKRAEALKEVLVKEFFVQANQLLSAGYEGNSPIIPQMIIDQFEGEIEEQEEFHRINRRIELVIADVQKLNEVRVDKTTRIEDLEATKPILYRGRTHTMHITTKSLFDSIQVLVSEDATVELAGKGAKTLELKIKTNTDKEKIALSLKAWIDGHAVFLTRKIMEVEDLGTKSLFLGDQKLSEEEINTLSDRELFLGENFICKYDTNEVFLEEAFELQFIQLKIGKKSIVSNGASLSEEAKKRIEKAKPGTIISFEKFQINKQFYSPEELNVDYIKKSKKRTSIFSQSRD